MVDDHTGVIETVMGSTTEYGRMRTTGSPSTVLANITGLIIVTAVEHPPLKPAMVDKFLIIAEFSGIRPLVCINKIDLVEDRLPVLDLVAAGDRVRISSPGTAVICVFQA